MRGEDHDNFDALFGRLIADNPVPRELKETGRAAVHTFRSLVKVWSNELEVQLVEDQRDTFKVYSKIWIAAKDLIDETQNWPLDEIELLEFDEALDEVIYFWNTLVLLLLVSEDREWDDATRRIVSDVSLAIHDQSVIDLCIRRWCWISSLFVSLYASTPETLNETLSNAARLHRVLSSIGLEPNWLSPEQLEGFTDSSEDPASSRERVLSKVIFYGVDALLRDVVSYEINDRIRGELSGLWLDALLVQAQEFGAARADRIDSLEL